MRCLAQFGKYFTYNGHSSADFNLALASFESVDSYESGIHRDVQRGDMNRYRYKPNHFGTTYNDVLTFRVTMIKDFCKEGTDLAFTRTEYRAIVDWLSEPEYPSLYHMYDDEEAWADEDEYYRGVFSEFENKAIGEVVGITATFTCDSPFAWSAINRLELNCELTEEEVAEKTEAGEPLVKTSTASQNIDSDEAYVYPLIVIEPKADGEITITNSTEGKSMKINVETSRRNTIYIDCEKLTISDEIGSVIPLYDIGITDPVSLYWFRFLKGTNSVEAEGNCIVKFEWREPRKVGAY